MVCDVGRNSGRLVLSAGHLEEKKLICVNFLLKKFGGNEKSSTFAPQSTREHSSVGLEHLPYKQRVRGSTPFAPTTKTTYSNVSRLFCALLRGVWGYALMRWLWRFAPMRASGNPPHPPPPLADTPRCGKPIPFGVSQAMSNVDMGLRG